MVSHSGLLTVIERAARKVAPQLRRDFGEVQHLQVSRKGPADFVTIADKKAEDTLVAELRKARPDWGFLLEEGGEIEGDPMKPRWVIDPLDGTTNFLHGIPHFAISIAVQEPHRSGQGWGEVTTGLIYQPILDETYWAEKSRGAWRHDQRLRVSARRDLTEAVIATGIPFIGHGDFSEWSRIFGAVAPSIAGIRRFGSAALDLAWVASGRYDGFWESGLSPWTCRRVFCSCVKPAVSLPISVAGPRLWSGARCWRPMMCSTASCTSWWLAPCGTPESERVPSLAQKKRPLKPSVWSGR